MAQIILEPSRLSTDVIPNQHPAVNAYRRQVSSTRESETFTIIRRQTDEDATSTIWQSRKRDRDPRALRTLLISDPMVRVRDGGQRSTVVKRRVHVLDASGLCCKIVNSIPSSAIWLMHQKHLNAFWFHDRPAWVENMRFPCFPCRCFLSARREMERRNRLALLGLILLVDPPHSSLGRLLNLILAAVVACTATAFLPARWFLQPAWRLVLTDDFGISLPGTLSPQPWISLGCFVSFLAGLSWLYFDALELALPKCANKFAFLAAGVSLLACFDRAHSGHTALPFWHTTRFGPSRS